MDTPIASRSSRLSLTAAILPRLRLRTLLREDSPASQANLSRMLHYSSLLLHLRPRSLPAAAGFSYTLHLGFLAVFCFGVELISGLFLMIYYSPTPESAYASIIRITGDVYFGNLLRDLHRLAGEVMLIVAVLHLLRTFLTDSFRGPRAFTWSTGVILLMLTFGLGFTGYLLPWDQLSFWAVTIGSGIVEAVPFVGNFLTRLMRGSAEIGAEGLLRFYVLHVLLLPLAVLLTVGIHYYRIVRIHGLSVPVRLENGDCCADDASSALRPVPFFPEIFSQELFLGNIALLVLITAVLFFYDAPLTHHADPCVTPYNAQAPCFFLWSQGLLKLGDKTMMGVFIPLILTIGLLALPYLDRSPRRSLARRPGAVIGVAVGALLIFGLSIIGTHHVGIDLPPATRILQKFAPDQGTGMIHAISYDALSTGIFSMADEAPGKSDTTVSSAFKALLDHFQTDVKAAAGDLLQAEAVVMVQEWQADLKRITFRISWQSDAQAIRQSAEQIIHCHRHGCFGSL